MRMLPVLTVLNTDTCQSYRLVDNCWTLGMIARTEHPRPADTWAVGVDAECPDCCPPCLAQQVYYPPSLGGAWWGAANPNNPAADEWFGILATSITLENTLSARRRGESTLTPVEWSPRRLEVRGQIVSSSARGTAFAWQQLNGLFSDSASCTNGSTTGWQVELQAFCHPGDVVDWGTIETWEPDELPPLLEDPDECDPCRRQDPSWEPTRLGPAVELGQTVVDNGARRVIDVRLLYIDVAESDSEVPLSSCEGDEIIMVFEVMSDDFYGDDSPASCTIDGFADNPERCRPYDWRWACRTLPDGDACPTDPYAATPSGLEPLVVSTTSTATSYCFPLWRSVRSCLAPAIPTSGDLAMNITVNAGTEAIRNLSIDVWTAWEGLPDPATCEGEQLYRAQRPLASAEIGYLPAGGRLNIDGAARLITQSCYGRPFSSAEGAVTSWNGGVWSHPKLPAGCRHWVVVTADCMHVNDLTAVEVSFTPRFTG